MYYCCCYYYSIYIYFVTTPVAAGTGSVPPPPVPARKPTVASSPRTVPPRTLLSGDYTSQESLDFTPRDGAAVFRPIPMQLRVVSQREQFQHTRSALCDLSTSDLDTASTSNYSYGTSIPSMEASVASTASTSDSVCAQFGDDDSPPRGLVVGSADTLDLVRGTPTSSGIHSDTVSLMSEQGLDLYFFVVV